MLATDGKEAYGFWKLYPHAGSQNDGVMGYHQNDCNYFDDSQNSWIETYTFSSGGYAIYRWAKTGEDFVLERLNSSFKSNFMNRNRWTKLTADSFQIIEERSYDSGKTWQIASTTKLKRVGGSF